jgi:DinB family protein
MAGIDTALQDAHDAAAEFLAAAEGSRSSWTSPRAPGKWSPCQTVEHVARALEESANVVSGAPSKFPTLPGVLRPVMRTVFFRRILARQAFPKAKTSKAFDPAGGPGSPTEARARLEGALARFDQACRARVASGRLVASKIFGDVSVEDFARFQALHIRHHRRQMPGA